MRGTAVLAAALLSLVASDAALGANHTVTFADAEDSVPYVPASLNVAVNDTVTFQGPFRWHPLVWNGGTFPETGSGTSATFTFTTSGTFRYFCSEHDDMRGAVTVAAAPGNQLPTADFTATPASPRAGDPVTFTATGSDADGAIVRFEWDLDGDGSFEAQGPTVSRTFPAGGRHRVAIRSIDNAGGASPVSAHDIVVAGAAGRADPGAPTARLLSTRLRLRAGVVALRIELDEPARVRATIRAGKRVLARANRALPAGREVRLRLAVSTAGRAALRRSPRVRARLVLVLRDPAGNRRTVTSRVTLRR